MIYTIHGKEKFRGNFERNVEQIYPINNEDEYLLIGDGTMDLMKLIVLTSRKITKNTIAFNIKHAIELVRYSEKLSASKA